MRIFPQELLILRLRGTLPPIPQLDWLRELSEDECLKRLRRLSQRDFGRDPDAWEQWWEEERIRLYIDPDF